MGTLYTFIVDPLKAMVYEFMGFIPTLVMTLLVLVVGLLVAKGLYYILHRIFTELHFNKFADRIGLNGLLHKGGIKHKAGDLISHLIYWVVIIMFLLITVKAIGLTMMTDLLHRVFAYVPVVISAVMVLVLGIIIAKVIGKFVYAVASNFGIPSPKLYDRITRYAIIFYTVTIFIEELGYGGLFVGTTFHILFAGIVFSFALAYGLAGRDAAARYIEGRKKK